jgi:hypothetical protein
VELWSRRSRVQVPSVTPPLQRRPSGRVNTSPESSQPGPTLIAPPAASAGARAGQPRWPVKSDRATALGRLRLSNVDLVVDHHTGPPRRDTPGSSGRRHPTRSGYLTPAHAAAQPPAALHKGGELGRREPHRREPLLYQEPGDGSVGRLDKGAGPHCGEGLIQGLLAWRLPVTRSGTSKYQLQVLPRLGTKPRISVAPRRRGQQLEQPVRVGVAVGGTGWLDGLALSVSRRAGGVVADGSTPVGEVVV